MTTILDRAGVILFGDDSELQASLNRAQASMQSAGRSMQQTGRTLSTRVTLPLAAMGAASVKAFSDFDGAMNQSLAIMGDVSEAMRTDMEAAARSVSRTTTVSATEAADAYFFLASAGLDAEQSIAALPQVAAFAQAGMFDMSTATDLATDAQSALGMAAEDAQENLTNLARVTDVLVGANTLANATVEQFSTALTTEAGAAMKTFNQDMEEGVAVLAAFADQGIKGQRAGSGYSRILRLMSQAAVNNKEEMQELGISFFDAQGNMRNMADVVENLTTVLGPMSDEQRAAALESIGFTARVQGIIQPLLGTSDAIREYEAALREAGGTTVEVADNQMQSFSAQMTVAKNNVQNAAIIIGDVMGPTLIKLGELLGAAARKFEEMSPAAQKVIVGVTALVAAIGPLLVALGTLSVAIGAISAPVLAVAAAFGALVAAGVALADNWAILVEAERQIKASVRGMVSALWDELIGRFGRLVDGVREKVDQVAGFFRDLRDRVVGNSYVVEMVDGIEREVKRLDDVMVAAVEEKTARVTDAFRSMAETGALAVKVMSQGFSSGFATDSGLAPLAGMEETARGVREQLAQINEQEAAVFATTIRWENALASGVSSAINRVSSQIGHIVTNFRGITDAAKRLGKTILTSVVQALTQAVVKALALKALLALSGGPGGFFGDVLAGVRQHGGHVAANRTYLVGERGPELFTPAAAGNITPNAALAGGPSASDLVSEALARTGGIQFPTPEAAAVSNFYRRLFSEFVQDGRDRGVDI